MTVPKYEVFSGLRDKDAVWLECVEGLGAAYECMKEIAAKSPGPYFVFCARTHRVLASIDTSNVQKHERRASA
jgi:hypothetical protein